MDKRPRVAREQCYLGLCLSPGLRFGACATLYVFAQAEEEIASQDLANMNGGVA